MLLPSKKNWVRIPSMVSKKFSLLLMFLLLFFPLACTPNSPSPQITPPENDTTPPFAKPTVLEFYADWCAACRLVAPVVNRLKQKYQGKVEIKRLNTDDPATRPWAEKYEVRAIPTFVFLNKSGKVLEKAVGALSEEELEQKIQSILD